MQNEKSKFKKNILLKDYTTFRIGGPAKYFFEAEIKRDIIKTVKWAKQKKVPFFILGGGSNLLISDKGFDGIVIKMQNAKIKMQNENAKCKIIKIEAGVRLEDLVKLSAQEGLTGLEWAAGIPEATVGGAISGNAAAFGKSMGDIVKSVEIFDTKEEKIKILQNKDCHFDYKESIFKKNRGLIILSAKLCLKKKDKSDVRKDINYVLDYRKKHHPIKFASAGSVFKNTQSISAAKLIEKCGLKGTQIGQAQISKKHANFIVNLGGATADDVLQLIDLAKKKVKQKLGLGLEEEVQYLPPHQN